MSAGAGSDGSHKPPPKGASGAKGAASGSGFSLASIGLSALGEAAAFGAGFALGRILEPEAVNLRQASWSTGVGPVKVLDASTVAELVAKYLVAFNPKGSSSQWAAREAKATGINMQRLELLRALNAEPPGVGELIELLRRGKIGVGLSDAIQPSLYEGLERHKIPAKWFAGIADLRHVHLSPQDAATAVQRAILPDPHHWLPVDAPAHGKHVRTLPQITLDPAEEGKVAGVSAQRMAVLTRLVGNPPGPHELLDLLNRGVIGLDDYRLGIAQGNLKNEWADSLLALKRRLLSPHEYAELFLRGWINKDARDHGAALSGMNATDTELLFKGLGRPITVKQITTGLARGGKFGGDYMTVPEPFRTSIRQSAIRPEWANLDYANRYTYPSPFVVRALLQAGDLTRAEGEGIFLKQGWEPKLAHLVATRLAQAKTSKAKDLTMEQYVAEYANGFDTRATLKTHLKGLGYSDAETERLALLGDARRVASTRTQRLGLIRTRYINHKLTREAMLTALDAISMTDEAHDHLVGTWDVERSLNQAQLSPAQIKRAYKRNIYDQATAVSLLEDRGYDPTDALVYLDIKPTVTGH